MIFLITNFRVNDIPQNWKAQLSMRKWTIIDHERGPRSPLDEATTASKAEKDGLGG